MQAQRTDLLTQQGRLNYLGEAAVWLREICDDLEEWNGKVGGRLKKEGIFYTYA